MENISKDTQFRKYDIDLSNMLNAVPPVLISYDTTMYNPITGQQVECQIFVGATYYKRLHQMLNQDDTVIA